MPCAAPGVGAHDLFLDFDPQAQLGQVQCPVLVMAGELGMTWLSLMRKPFASSSQANEPGSRADRAVRSSGSIRSREYTSSAVTARP